MVAKELLWLIVGAGVSSRGQVPARFWMLWLERLG